MRHLEKSEIAKICNDTYEDVITERAWHANELGCYHLEPNYKDLCDVMEQNGMDSSALREAKKLVMDEIDTVDHKADPSWRDLKRIHKLDDEFIHAIKDACKEISKTFGIINELNPSEPSMESSEPSMEEDLDDKDYLPFC
ncbi:hypothetical protein ACKX2L_06610 [Lachnospiraceae bacterium YH-ros2228]